MKSNQTPTLFSRLKKHDFPLITGVMLLATGLFVKGYLADIHLSDTYFVMETGWLLAVLGCFLTIVSLFYFFTNRYLFSPILSWTHIIINICCCFLIPSVFLIYNLNSDGDNGFSKFKLFNNIQLLLLTIIFLSQLIYFVNLTFGIITYLRRRN